MWGFRKTKWTTWLVQTTSKGLREFYSLHWFFFSVMSLGTSKSFPQSAYPLLCLSYLWGNWGTQAGDLPRSTYWCIVEARKRTKKSCFTVDCFILWPQRSSAKTLLLFTWIDSHSKRSLGQGYLSVLICVLMSPVAKWLQRCIMHLLH